MDRTEQVKQLTKRYVLVGIVCLLVLGAGVVLLVNNQNSDKAGSEELGKSQAQIFVDNDQNVSLEYPNKAKRLELTEQDKADKFLFRASGNNETPYLITLRYEDGLSKASQLARTGTIDLLLANTDKAFPTRYPGYTKLSEQKFDHNGKQAAQIDFTYTANDGQAAQQRLYIFLDDENTAYYLSLQSKVSDFAKLETMLDATAGSFEL